MRKQRGDGNVQVFRITGARTGLAEDVRGRQRRYIISMTIRTMSVILAVTLWNVERYVAVVALVLGALLPYVAVVIANAGRERPPSLPSTFGVAPTRLGAPPTLSAVGEIAPPRAEATHAESVPEDVVADPAAGAVSGERPESV
ncbi:DUF3099 domain-containing protein [Streptomyces hyaluromycini]|uniref:DUF3099 domain-containing protein n=1 Tax=Streptomyces hyaluromycini TaxID=1377993 RepID=A0ABV1WYS4_9ACTN|nr:DUF3099 domain-containing protein [Streptomyces hyaluromycini]